MRWLALLLLLATGCAVGADPQRVNPSFALTKADARAALADEAKDPIQLDRPLLILGGFLDPGFGPAHYAALIRPYVAGRMLLLTYADCFTFEHCRQRTVSRVEAAFGKAGEDETVEVDVIGESMGGLVALHAAMSDPALGKRLKIRRLFTLSSPLAGANRAAVLPMDFIPLIRDMRPGSQFLTRLGREAPAFEVHSYTHLDDNVVGERYAALPGRRVWWLDNGGIGSAHVSVFRDERIVLDIVRRLRGATPVTREPAAPLPETPAQER